MTLSPTDILSSPQGDPSIFSALSGKLIVDSPHVHKLLSRSLAPAEVEVVAKSFRISASEGALSEWPIVREKGVSFNPRAARLMHIILTELNDKSVVLLAACPLFLVKDLSNITAVQCDLEHSIRIAEDAKSLSPQSKEGRKVLLAKALDDTRHLHRTSVTTKERREYLQYLKENISPLASGEETTRISILLAAAIERQERAIPLECE